MSSPARPAQRRKEDTVYRIVITPPKSSEGPGYVRLEPGKARRKSSRRHGSQKVANAELRFDEGLCGLSLCGFSIFDNGSKGFRVSFPTRRFVSAGGGPGAYLLLRATDPNDRTAYERLKQEILDTFLAFVGDQQLSATEAAS
jgi:hypothetical protein